MEKQRKSPVSIQLPPYGIWGFSSMHSKNFIMDEESDPYYELFLVRDGEGVCHWQGEEVPLRKNSLLLIRPHQVHRIVDGKKPLRLYGICYDPSAFHGFDPEGVVRAFADYMPSMNALECSEHTRRLITSRVKEILFEQTEKGFGHTYTIRAGLFSLMITLVRSSDVVADQEMFDPIESSIAFIQQHFYQPLVVHELAEDCGLSTRRYTELFKKKTGQTCITYINTLRIEYAKKRLRTSKDINMAMLDSGFHDVSHFYKLFKEHVGMPPREWIEGSAGEQN